MDYARYIPCPGEAILTDLAGALAEHDRMADVAVGRDGSLRAVAARGACRDAYRITVTDDEDAGRDEGPAAPMAAEYGMPDAIDDHLDLCDAVLACMAASRHRGAIRGLSIEDCEGGSVLRFRYRAIRHVLRICRA